jgi:hypothetical protein
MCRKKHALVQQGRAKYCNCEAWEAAGWTVLRGSYKRALRSSTGVDLDMELGSAHSGANTCAAADTSADGGADVVADDDGADAVSDRGTDAESDAVSDTSPD